MPSEAANRPMVTLEELRWSTAQVENLGFIYFFNRDREAGQAENKIDRDF